MERTNRTLKDLLRMYVSDKQTTWDEYLFQVVYAYNNAIHSSTGLSPHSVIYGNRSRTVGDSVFNVQPLKWLGPLKLVKQTSLSSRPHQRSLKTVVFDFDAYYACWESISCTKMSLLLVTRISSIYSELQTTSKDNNDPRPPKLSLSNRRGMI